MSCVDTYITCIHASMHTCIHAYMHTCIRTLHAYMHTCIHAYMHTCIHAYMHTYITCIHAYMHACTHTHIQVKLQHSQKNHKFTYTYYMHMYVSCGTVKTALCVQIHIHYIAAQNARPDLQNCTICSHSYPLYSCTECSPGPSELPYMPTLIHLLFTFTGTTEQTFTHYFVIS